MLIRSTLSLALLATSTLAYMNPCDGSYAAVAIGAQFELSFLQPGPCGGATIASEDGSFQNLAPDYSGCSTTPIGAVQIFNVTFGSFTSPGFANLTFICREGVRCYSFDIANGTTPAKNATIIQACAGNTTSTLLTSLAPMNPTIGAPTDAAPAQSSRLSSVEVSATSGSDPSSSASATPGLSSLVGSSSNSAESSNWHAPGSFTSSQSMPYISSPSTSSHQNPSALSDPSSLLPTSSSPPMTFTSSPPVSSNPTALVQPSDRESHISGATFATCSCAP